MKTLLNLFALMVLPACCLGQITIKDTSRLPFFKEAVKRSFERAPQFSGSVLDSLDKQLRLGNKDALLALTPYLDDTTHVTRFLGYHKLTPQKRSVALSLIQENVSFLPTEIMLDNKLSGATFNAFTDANFDKIRFDKNAQVFLITPMDERNVDVEILELTYQRRGDLNRSSSSLLNFQWLKSGEIDMLIGLHDSYALYKIAARLYRNRYRFDENRFDAADYTNLLQLLTGIDIGVKNEKGEITHHVEKEFYTTASENLLIYIAKNYEAFKWDEHLGVFVNSGIKADKPVQEAVYFERLRSQEDTIALNAFINLTTCRPKEVGELADSYDDARIDANYALPTFPYRFLKQMVLLTDYCRRNGIDFGESPRAKQFIKDLRGDLSFLQRRKLEDKIARELSLKDVTAFEYWTLVYEKNTDLDESAGRILDIFYSNNWDKMVTDKAQLSLFLKKSRLYDNLGIIGICNNYLVKFVKTHDPTETNLRKLKPTDKDILVQLPRAITLAGSDNRTPEKVEKLAPGQQYIGVKDARAEFEHILQNNSNSDTIEFKIAMLLEKLNYGQIGTAIRMVEPLSFKWSWHKYSFLKGDFGFAFIDFDDSNARKEFLSIYNSHSEYGVYTYCLKQAGIDYLGANKKPDYDKIYNILKYNAAIAFVGGGGSRETNEVYMIIKLLELTFNTTLGFPHKLCHTGYKFSCATEDASKEWMDYLKIHGLLHKPHNEPYAFSYFGR